jgi:hypothetical protein
MKDETGPRCGYITTTTTTIIIIITLQLTLISSKAQEISFAKLQIIAQKSQN